ncbi:MAG: succinoglycan biosynthesis protein [Caulobacteraceae bacterium]|nr:succinoglycan biosynthesis protein [Caulobacteraceae bacterium]
MRIAYFVHDLSDATVAKRIRMLAAGGAEVVVLFGFRRTAEPIVEVAGVPVVDLGRTADAQLLKRAGSVASNLFRAPAWRRRLAGVDVVLARNLEVLVLAAAARRLHAPRARLAYECLDVHGLMLSPSLAGRALRLLEGGLLEASDLLIVSSEAFVREYFEPLQRTSSRPRLATLVVENKALPSSADNRTERSARPPAGRPWRIGWFGMIRCRRSLDILTGLARRRPDLLQVDIRGRPSYTEFDDFDSLIGDLANVSFVGAYRPRDLQGMYARTHFNWAIDYFQNEGNSRWLLPNRLYEGGRFGVPAIARRGCETSRWLEGRSLGVVLDDPEQELERFLEELTPQAYTALAEQAARAPVDYFVAGPRDCQLLIAAFGQRGLVQNAATHATALGPRPAGPSPA